MPESCLGDCASREIILVGENALSKITIPLGDPVKEASETLNAVEAVSGILQYEAPHLHR